MKIILKNIFVVCCLVLCLTLCLTACGGITKDDIDNAKSEAGRAIESV